MDAALASLRQGLEGAVLLCLLQHLERGCLQDD